MTLWQVCGRLFSNLPQKNDVLHSSVAGVATVAGFFISTHETTHTGTRAPEKHRNKSESAATPATVATALSWRANSCGRFARQVATNLPRPEVTPCP